MSLETGKRGAAKIFLEVASNSSAGRLGNGLHNYLRRTAEEWHLMHNCDTEVEKSLLVDGQRKFVDLSVIWPDGRTEAVEVETEYSPRALGNIEKNILLGFDVVSVLTPNSKVREAIRTRMVKEVDHVDQRRVCFPTISFYDK